MAEQEDVLYYLTVGNEPYVQPAMPDGAEDGILKGMYPLHTSEKPGKVRAQLMGSGTILREVIAASELLMEDFGVIADVWSATSFNELRRDALEVERWNHLHPEEPQRKSWIDQCLGDRPGPYIAATDYMKIVADYNPRGNVHTVIEIDSSKMEKSI